MTTTNVREPGPNEHATHFGYCVGFAALLFGHSAHHRKYTCAELQAHFVVPYRLGQFRLYYNGDGDVTALVTWAWLSDHTLARVMDDDHYALHTSEWNEGTHLYIMDLVAPFGHFREVARDLLRTFPQVTHWHSVRRSADVRIRKRTAWQRGAAARGFGQPAGAPHGVAPTP
jgi:cytolysin-activating lysine-acyltransferase